MNDNWTTIMGVGAIVVPLVLGFIVVMSVLS